MAGINAMDFQSIGGEIVGAEDIVGADDESVAELLGIMGEIVGEDDDDDFDVGAVAKAVRRAGAKKAVLQALAKKKRAAKMGLGTVDVQPNLGRYLMAGGRAVQGAATGSLDCQVVLQEKFRPQRLNITVLTDAGVNVALNAIIISDILCGSKSQLSSLGYIPASMFGADAANQMAGFMFDTVQAGTAFTVRFNSITALYSVIIGVGGCAIR